MNHRTISKLHIALLLASFATIHASETDLTKAQSISVDLGMGGVDPTFGANYGGTLGVYYGQWQDSNGLRKGWSAGLGMHSAATLFVSENIASVDAFLAEAKVQRALVWPYLGLGGDLGLGLGMVHRVKENCTENCLLFDTGKVYKKIRDDLSPHMVISASGMLTLLPKSAVSADLGARVLSYPGLVLFATLRGNW